MEAGHGVLGQIKDWLISLRSGRSERGFTIVELLIVIVVIGILAALVLNTISGVQHRSRVAKVNSDLAAIKKSFLAYKQDKGELPPIGDFWNAGSNPPGSTFETLAKNAVISSGHAASDFPVMDPWGFYYAYDDNDCNVWAQGQSWVLSVGPDGVRSTTDDIRITVSLGCLSS